MGKRIYRWEKHGTDDEPWWKFAEYDYGAYIHFSDYSGIPNNYSIELYPDMLRCADINKDGKPEIMGLIFYHGRSPSGKDQFFMDGIKNGDWVSSGAKHLYKYPKETDFDQVYMNFAFPNVDNDSLVVSYDRHELRYTNPIVIATIASPPYWDGNESEGSTSFGYANTTSSTVSTENTISAGLSIGFEWESPAGTYGASVKANLTKSMNCGISTTTEVSESWGYQTQRGQDMVVYTTIPFDVYYYNIISSPDPKAIGTQMQISVPRDLVTMNCELDYYNENNGDAKDIKMHHTKGKPFTYYTKAEKDSFESKGGNNGLFGKKMMRVGIGGGKVTLELSKDQITEKSKGHSVEVSVEVEGKAGYATAGVNAGYAHDYNYTLSVGKGIYCAGEVPNNPTGQDFTNKSFQAGIMSFPYYPEGQKSYTVVSYYVSE